MAWFLDEFSCYHFWAGLFLFDPDWKWHDLGHCGWSAGARHVGIWIEGEASSRSHDDSAPAYFLPLTSHEAVQ